MEVSGREEGGEIGIMRGDRLSDGCIIAKRMWALEAMPLLMAALAGIITMRATVIILALVQNK